MQPLRIRQAVVAGFVVIVVMAVLAALDGDGEEFSFGALLAVVVAGVAGVALALGSVVLIRRWIARRR